MSTLDLGLAVFIVVLIALLGWSLWQTNRATEALIRITKRMKATNDEIESEIGEP